MDQVKRVNYFQGMMLVDEDFRAEQNYHLQKRHNHNLELHTWGVVRGLEVSLKRGALDVTEGLAIDASGREMWWRGGAPAIAASPEDGAFLVMDWNEELSDEYPQMAGRFLRLIDGCKFSFKSAAEANDVVVAKISVKEGQIQEQPDNSVRRTASSVSANGGDLEIRPVAGNGSLRFMTGAPFAARLAIDVKGNVGIGTAPTASRLSIYSEAGPDYSGSLMDFVVGGPYKLSLGFKALERDSVSYHLDLHNNLGNKFEKFLVFHKGNVRVANDLSVSGALSVRGALTLRVGDDNRPDTNHGLCYFGEGDKDAGEFAIDGPSLYGYQGGALGNSGKKIALRWDGSGKVGIGTSNPQSPLVVSGKSAKMGMLKLANSNAKAGDQWWLGFNHGDDSTDENDRGRVGVDILAGGAGRLFFTTGLQKKQQERMRIDETGNVGIATPEPKHLLQIGGSVDGIGFQGSDGSPNAGYIRFGDGTGWKLHFGQSQVGANVLGGHDGIFMTLQDKGYVGIGTTDPAAPLDVKGRILRNGKDFSFTGTANHDEKINVPWGTTQDWNIFFSPNSMGRQEPGSEGDNALLMILCSVIPDTTTRWHVQANFKYRYANKDAAWEGGVVNYLIVPK